MTKNIIKSNTNMYLKEFVNSDWHHSGLVEHIGTLLHVASRTRDFSLVRKAIEYGAEVNKVDSEGQTALFAIGKLDTAKVLIKAGIDPNIVDSGGRTALITIYERNPIAFRDIIEYLIPITNLDLPEEPGKTLLFTMCKNAEGNYNMFKMVLNNTKNLNRLFKGETFLFDAGRRIKNDRIFLLLAKSGVNLYHKNVKGLDFYDCCTKENKRLIEKHLPEFVQRRK